MEAEPLDIIKEHNARYKEDLGEVEGLDPLPLVTLKLDPRVLSKIMNVKSGLDSLQRKKGNSMENAVCSIMNNLKKLDTVLCVHVLGEIELEVELENNVIGQCL